MTLDEDDVQAVGDEVMLRLTGGGAGFAYMYEQGTCTAEETQTRSEVALTGFIGVEGDYSGQLLMFVTRATRKRTIVQHTTTTAADGVTKIHHFRLNIPLGAPPVVGDTPDRAIVC